jgi:hypothetical protein
MVRTQGRKRFFLKKEAKTFARLSRRGGEIAPSGWRSGLIDKLADYDTAVHFNLDSVGVWGGIN